MREGRSEQPPDSLPVWFIAHGAPTHLLSDQPVRRFWQRLAGELPSPPRALLCVSAHWLSSSLSIAGCEAQPRIQYDFFGFPEVLYRIQWAVQGDEKTANWLVSRLEDLLDRPITVCSRAFDHGLWVPLSVAWPQPPFPIYQLALGDHEDPFWHLELGRRLASLRHEGVLIVGSGGIVHNLSCLDWGAPLGKAEAWAQAFLNAVEEALFAHNEARLCQPWCLPYGRKAVPSMEHYLPLLVAVGAGGEARRLYAGWEYGCLAMHSYAFA